MGTESPRNISPFFPAHGSGSSSSTIEYADSVPACARMRTSSKRVREKSTPRSDQVLQLTDYHVSRHVVSMFKCLTTTTTHCDLSHFHYPDGASTSNMNIISQPRPSTLWFQHKLNNQLLIFSRVIGNHSTSTESLSIAN